MLILKKTLIIFTIVSVLTILTMFEYQNLQPGSGGFTLLKESEAKGKSLKNLLLNPSFEDEDHIKYWKNYGNVTFNWTTDWHHSGEGKWSFGVGNDADWAKDNAEGGCYQILRDPKRDNRLLKVKPGQILVFKMKVKIEVGYTGKASLKVEFYDYDVRKGFSAGPLKTYQSVKLSEVVEWEEIIVKAKAPKKTVSVVVRGCSEEMSKGSKFVFFDEGLVIIE